MHGPLIASLGLSSLTLAVWYVLRALSWKLIALMFVVSILHSYCLEPKKMNSVLVSFIFNLLRSIQSLTTVVVSVNAWIVSCSSYLEALLKDILSAWSSAYPWMSMIVGTTVFIVLAHA